MRLIALVAVAGVLAACGGTKTVVRTTTVTTTHSPIVSGTQWLHGEIRSVKADGNRFLLVFDPSLFLSGIAANVAQAQDQHRVCVPSKCPPVDNDNYVVDESHRTVTFLLPATIHGTVLVSSSDRRTITGSELAKLVAGTSTLKLYEPLQSGVWINVHIDTVRTFAQQYVP
jgi:hypothetical protein